MLIDSFTENVMEVLKSRLASFAQSFLKVTELQLSKPWSRFIMRTIHVWKGTQLQHNHEFEVLNNMDDILQSVEIAASSTV